MRLHSDPIELIQFEVMKLVLDQSRDRAGIPDPRYDFDGCVEGMAVRVQSRISAVPDDERHDWFIDQAMATVGWLEAHRAPDVLIERASAWAIRLLKYRPA